MHTITETVLPGVRGVANPLGGEGRGDALGFVLPVDDTSFRISPCCGPRIRRGSTRSVRSASVRSPTPPTSNGSPATGKRKEARARSRLHSEEHLATSDRGVRMLRRLLQQQMQIVADGGDPINVGFEPGSELVAMECGQSLS